MDFELSPELQDLKLRVHQVLENDVIPAENSVLAESRAGRRDRLKTLQAQARALGLWTPHLPRGWGGLGLGMMGMAALFREMGRSPVGAKVFNCDAPDQGNMDLLVSSASPAMQERYLRPLCAGEISSAFCMTEPAPGAGADPTNLKTRATPDGDGFVLDGHKWFATGGGAAAFLLVMARTSDNAKTGATMFVVDRHAPGVEHLRDVPTMGPDMLDHREAELVFHGVRVPAEQILGGVGEGFALAQRRLVPARLTHCMRWLGLAERTMSLCTAYLQSRESFGKVLARHQSVQNLLAENAAAIHAGNLMTWHAAWLLEKGQALQAKPYASMAKNHVATTLCKVLDDAIQMHGALGISQDLPFGDWYRMARAARIADGPEEVHRVAVARDFLLGRLPLLVG